MELWWLVVLVLGVVMSGSSEVANPPRPEPGSASNEAANKDSRDHTTSSAFRLLQGATTDTPALIATGGKAENENESTEKQEEANENGKSHAECLECILCKIANCTAYNKTKFGHK